MGMNTALKTSQILENAWGVLGIELMAAAQALDFRDHQFGDGSRQPMAPSGSMLNSWMWTGRSTPTTTR